MYETGLQPLTKELRQKLVEEIVGVLRDEYVYPQRGEAIILVLEEKLQSGEYDSFEDSEKFSWQLNSDLRNATTNDGRMFISFHEPPFEYEEEKENQYRNEYRNEYLQKIQYGFGNISFDTEAIPGKTVAMLPIFQLLSLDEPGARNTIGEKMNSVADADILILDLRDCFGMDSKTAAFVLSQGGQ